MESDNLPPFPESGVRLLDGTIVYLPFTTRAYAAAAVASRDAEIERLRAERDALIALLEEWLILGYSNERDARTQAAIDAARKA